MPSLWNSMGDKALDYPTEIDANKRAFRYFSKYVDDFTYFEDGKWKSKWVFRNNPISADSNLNNVNSVMTSSWKTGLMRLKWYDLFTPIDLLGIMNNVINQINSYK